MENKNCLKPPMVSDFFENRKASRTIKHMLGGISHGYTQPESTIRMRQLSTENGMLLTSEYREMAQNHGLIGRPRYVTIPI